MRAVVPLGPWTPDLPGPNGDTLQIAINVLPIPNGYRPLQGFVPQIGGGLPSRPLGGASYRSAARVTTTFAGTEDTLYTYTADLWQAAGTGYTASDDNAWSFVQFGQRVIASNGSDAPQFYVLDETSTFAPLPGVTDAALVTTNPPRMKLLAIVRDFVVGGVINGDATTMQWSGINNSSEWRPSYGQSDYQQFPDGGSITAIAGGEYGLVFQEESIRRMTYVAGNLIFQFDVISPNVGCIHPRSFAQIGKASYFLSARGFMVCNGSTVTPIGDEKVDRTFLAALDPSYLARMSCVADPVRKVVYWSVPAATPNTWFAYSWTLGQWSQVSAPVSLMIAGRAQALSLDDEAAPPDTFDMGLPFDDASYLGGQQGFYLFDDTYTLGSLSGPNMAATLGFSPMEVAGAGTITRARRWRVDTDAVTGQSLALDARLRLGDAPNVTTHTGPTTSGDIVGRRKGRTIAPTLTIAAGTPWTYAQSLEVEFDRGGMR